MSTTIKLLRDRISTDGPTMGVLTTPVATYQTLELPWKGNEPLVSCIPAGAYLLGVVMSAKFGRRMPILLDVPGRTGIEIHPGNSMANTTGCILVGTERASTAPPTLAFGSRIASESFNTWLRGALAGGTVSLEISYAGSAS